jgi:uncharacterized protein (TIGR04255 family)
MPFPKKISPDLLKDSIVEIRFTTKLEQRLLILGLLSRSLSDKGFKLMTSSGDSQKPKGGQITVNLLPTQPTFYNDHITCKITPLGFMFNCKEKYIGWEKYKVEIASIINSVEEVGIVSSYYRVGLRYINTISSGLVFAKTSDNIKVTFKDFEIQNTNLKTEILQEEFKILVNIGDDYVIQTSQEKVSLFDIDVIHEKPDGYASADELLIVLDDCHTKEKQLFFTLLNENFVATLNPEL